MPLPVPPAPRPASSPAQRSFAAADPERALVFDVPRYFIEVKVPGYSVEKTVARARRTKQQRQLAQTDESANTEPQADSVAESMPHP